MPSYMPENKTIDQVKNEMMLSIKAAVPSYGEFGGQLLNHYSEDPAADEAWKDAIAPIRNIPDAKERSVPQYLTRGTNDLLIRDERTKAAFRQYGIYYAAEMKTCFTSVPATCTTARQ
jgi:acetyl esterase